MKPKMEKLSLPAMLARRAGVVVALIIAGGWLAMLMAELLPEHWMRWHVVADIEAAGDGVARVYYDIGGGVEESKTVDRKFREGRRTLRFVLPENPLHGLRLDPIDQQVDFVVHELRLVGPLGIGVVALDSKKKEKPVEISIKPEQAINAALANGSSPDSTSLAFEATSEDPHFYLRVKPKPVLPPESAHRSADAAVVVVGLLLTLLVFLLVKWSGQLAALEPFTFALAAAAVVAWVLAHYVLKVQRIDAGFAYRLVLPVLLLATLTVWLRGGLGRCRVPLASLALVAWLAYFGLRALAVSEGMVPSCLDLLLAAFFLLALLTAGLTSGPKMWRRYLRLGFMIWLPVAVLSAIYLLVKSYHPDWELSYRAAYFQSPLFRPISGSACFATGAVAIVALSVEKRLPLVFRVLMILALAVLCVYFLQAKSRAVVVGVVVAVIFVGALSRSIQVVIAAALALSICAVFAYTPWPSSIADALSGDNASLTPGEELEAHRVKGELVRPMVLRPAIYSSYLRASMDHPVFGHGFAGDHAIVIDSADLAEVRPNFVGRPWNPHNFHLSVLYFGGIVGVLLHAIMLGLPMWFGLRAFLKNRDPLLLALLGMVAFAGIKLLFESTMMNVAKDAVVFWRPNEYWLFFWGPLVLLNIHLSHSPIDCHPQCDDDPDLPVVGANPTVTQTEP
jgi:hypothetical protein